MSFSHKDLAIERLGSALKAALGDVKQDPEFLGKIVNTVAIEFGLDSIAAMYLSSKLKNMLRAKYDKETEA